MNASVKYFFCLFILWISVVQGAIVLDGNVNPEDPDDWKNASSVYIGQGGDGSLALTAGSTISTGNSFVGDTENATGTATVSDNDSLWSCSELIVGNMGLGNLTILDEGSVQSVSSVVGQGATSIGTVTVSGANSVWHVSTTLRVGEAGDGVLYITDGGKVLVRQTQGLMIDSQEDGRSFIKMSAGGILGIYGDVDDSLDTFLSVINGTKDVRWWNTALNDWDSITTATIGTDYTLERQAGGKYNNYTFLTVTSTESILLPGDANRDGTVDGSDATILASHWQVTGTATWEMGDFNGDLTVDGSDATILANHWLESNIPSGDSVTVPEPGTVVLLLFGLLALGIRQYFR